jgi:hypothetical protein
MTSASPPPQEIVSQADFIGAALNPDLPAPRGLVGPDGMSSPKRFAVYRNNILVSLKDALATGFPATAALVGPDFFSALSDIYIRGNPPRSPILALFGENLAEFIAGFPPAQSLPYLADVARLEYALRFSYHAKNAPAIAPERLQDPRLFSAKVRLAPAVQLVSSSYPVLEIHAAATGGPAPKSGAQDVLITRPDFDPIPTSFPPDTLQVIEAIMAQNTLSEAIELAPTALDLTALITALVTGGAITQLEFDDV